MVRLLLIHTSVVARSKDVEFNPKCHIFAIPAPRICRRSLEPGGLDAVFHGLGSDYIEKAFPLLRRGGVLVAYGKPLSMRGLMHALAKILVLNLRPNGRTFRPKAVRSLEILSWWRGNCWIGGR